MKVFALSKLNYCTKKKHARHLSEPVVERLGISLVPTAADDSSGGYHKRNKSAENRSQWRNDSLGGPRAFGSACEPISAFIDQPNSLTQLFTTYQRTLLAVYVDAVPRNEHEDFGATARRLQKSTVSAWRIKVDFCSLVIIWDATMFSGKHGVHLSTSGPLERFV